MSYQLKNPMFKAFLLIMISMLLLVYCKPVVQQNSDLARAERMFESGEFNRLKSLNDSLLEKGNVTSGETRMLDSLLELSNRIKHDFRLHEVEVITRLMKYFPELDSNMLKVWETNNKLEMRYIDGEKRFFTNAVPNLFRLDDAAKKRKVDVDGFQVDSLDLFRLAHTKNVVDETKVAGIPVSPVKMTICYSVDLESNAVPEGKIIRCWLPYPREGNPRQKGIKLLNSDPSDVFIAPESSMQRTIYMEKKAVKDQPTHFGFELELKCSAQYFDLSPENINPTPVESDVYREFTTEKFPHIVFSPQIRQLAARILGGETNPLVKVQKIYNWINDTIRWASALEYSIIPNIPSYVLKTGHGDCGMQTLLFMSLVRSQGIPAKWQSGLMLHPKHVNLHDWCEVYFEGVGWVPVDQSFGLQDSPDAKVRNFYNTGIDSYRLIVNDDYGCKLNPEKKFYRSEPIDFQRGELEWEGGNLYFDQWDWNIDVKYE